MEVRVKIERKGDGFAVATSENGNGYWGVGVEFPMYVAALSVASSIAVAVRACGGDARVVDESEVT